jgi:hypothetical protein
VLSVVETCWKSKSFQRQSSVPFRHFATATMCPVDPPMLVGTRPPRTSARIVVFRTATVSGPAVDDEVPITGTRGTPRSISSPTAQAVAVAFGAPSEPIATPVAICHRPAIDPVGRRSSTDDQLVR